MQKLRYVGGFGANEYYVGDECVAFYYGDMKTPETMRYVILRAGEEIDRGIYPSGGIEDKLNALLRRGTWTEATAASSVAKSKIIQDEVRAKINDSPCGCWRKKDLADPVGDVAYPQDGGDFFSQF